MNNLKIYVIALNMRNSCGARIIIECMRKDDDDGEDDVDGS
jgi:hypothetical protein